MATHPLIEFPRIHPHLEGGGAAPRSHSLELSCDPSQVAVARRFLDEGLRDAFAVSLELVEDAVLVGSELVANAISHASSDRGVTVAWADVASGGLRISVTDGSPTLPRRVSPEEAAERGRGLEVVAALSTAWGIRLEQDSKTVFAELRISSSPVSTGPAVCTRCLGEDDAALGGEQGRSLRAAPDGDSGLADLMGLRIAPAVPSKRIVRLARRLHTRVPDQG